MKRSSFLVVAVGLVLIGLFTIRCTGPSIPVIAFLSPTAGEPIVTSDDPLDTPITVPVDVAFPPAVNPCAGDAQADGRHDCSAGAGDRCLRLVEREHG